MNFELQSDMSLLPIVKLNKEYHYLVIELYP